jgi:hypothetical protein
VTAIAVRRVAFGVQLALPRAGAYWGVSLLLLLWALVGAGRMMIGTADGRSPGRATSRGRSGP